MAPPQAVTRQIKGKMGLGAIDRKGGLGLASLRRNSQIDVSMRSG
jgi:hypothetical protein